MKTQANKLNLVLHNGSIRQVKASEIYDELEKSYSDPNNKHLYTKKEEFKKVQNHILNHRCCWEFKPYEGIDAEWVRQWSDNPFTLIDFIYNELNNR